MSAETSPVKEEATVLGPYFCCAMCNGLFSSSGELDKHQQQPCPGLAHLSEAESFRCPKELYIAILEQFNDTKNKCQGTAKLVPGRVIGQKRKGCESSPIKVGRWRAGRPRKKIVEDEGSTGKTVSTSRHERGVASTNEKHPGHCMKSLTMSTLTNDGTRVDVNGEGPAGSPRKSRRLAVKRSQNNDQKYLRVIQSVGAKGSVREEETSIAVTPTKLTETTNNPHKFDAHNANRDEEGSLAMNGEHAAEFHSLYQVKLVAAVKAELSEPHGNPGCNKEDATASEGNTAVFPKVPEESTFSETQMSKKIEDHQYTTGGKVDVTNLPENTPSDAVGCLDEGGEDVLKSKGDPSRSWENHAGEKTRRAALNKGRTKTAAEAEEQEEEENHLSVRKKREKLLSDLAKKYEEFLDVTKADKACYRCKTNGCAFSSHHVGHFDRHMVTCHNHGQCFKCSICEFRCEDSRRYRMHVNQHTKPFLCETCSARFCTERQLKVHTQGHQGTFPYQCEQCEYKTRFPSAFKEHCRKHTGDTLKCSQCEFTTIYSYALKSHTNARHSVASKFKCDLCNYVTNDRNCIRNHRARHGGVKNYRCPCCSFRSYQRGEVLKHFHTHTKEMVYFCDQCKFSCAYPYNFRVHMMQHLGVAPWQCSVCGYNSVTKQRVLRHQKTQHPGQPAVSVINLGLKLDLNLKDFKQNNADKTESKTAKLMKKMLRVLDGVSDGDSGMRECDDIVIKCAAEGEESVTVNEHENAQEEEVEEGQFVTFDMVDHGQVADGEQVVEVEEVVNSEDVQYVQVDENGEHLGRIDVVGGGGGGEESIILQIEDLHQLTSLAQGGSIILQTVTSE